MPEISSPVDLLIRGGLVMTMDDRRRILAPGDVAVQDGLIAGVGEHLQVEARQVLDARGRAVLPGLVDAHMHETLTRGLCEDRPLDRWLSEICFPLDRSYTAEIMRAAALMNQLEMIRGGVTTFLDIYRFPGECAEVAVRSGLRAVFVPQIMAEPSDTGESVESAAAFVAEWHGRHPRITAGFGPHAPYTCPPETYQRVAELAEKYDAPIHTHLSETDWETGFIAERYGGTPAEHLDRLGLLSPRLSVAHGVKLTAADIALLKARGVAVVYNPSSNVKLASGTAPIPDMLAAGLIVGLGTDSNLSNNNLDMFEEMRLGAMLQKLGRGDAAALPCMDVLAMATIGSARALGMGRSVGSLEAGKQADIILIDLDQPHLWPLLEGQWLNLAEQLVYSAGAADVSHTIVAGQILMEDRRVTTLDPAGARDLVHAAAHDLMVRAGLVQP